MWVGPGSSRGPGCAGPSKSPGGTSGGGLEEDEYDRFADALADERLTALVPFPSVGVTSLGQCHWISSPRRTTASSVRGAMISGAPWYRRDDLIFFLFSRAVLRVQIRRRLSSMIRPMAHEVPSARPRRARMAALEGTGNGGDMVWATTSHFELRLRRYFEPMDGGRFAEIDGGEGLLLASAVGWSIIR